jgi:hypothetical protein
MFNKKQSDQHGACFRSKFQGKNGHTWLLMDITNLSVLKSGFSLVKVQSVRSLESHKKGSQTLDVGKCLAEFLLIWTA